MAAALMAGLQVQSTRLCQPCQRQGSDLATSNENSRANQLICLSNRAWPDAQCIVVFSAGFGPSDSGSHCQERAGAADIIHHLTVDRTAKEWIEIAKIVPHLQRKHKFFAPQC